MSKVEKDLEKDSKSFLGCTNCSRLKSIVG
jgi:hypothetical protein